MRSLLLAALLLATAGLAYLLTNQDSTNQATKAPVVTMPEGLPMAQGDNHRLTREELQDRKRQKRADKKAWIEMMHSAPEGVDWHQVETATRYAKHQEKALIRKNARAGEEVLADGHLTGQWNERGSNNLAGRTLVTNYDAVTDEIWLVSAGGTLWKGPRDGSAWEVINQDLQFEGDLLEFIPTPTGRRLIATVGRVPHYSDDDGLTWTSATGITYDDSWGTYHTPVVLNDAQNSIYLLAKPNYWADWSLYKSIDKGESYQQLLTLDDYDSDKYALHSPHFVEEVYMLEQTDTTGVILHQINKLTDSFDTLSTSTTGLFGGRANLSATVAAGDTLFYIYTGNNEIFASTDFGQTWTKRGDLPFYPWSVGVYVTPSSEDDLFMGEVECFHSEDGGANWTKLNNWWDYYDNVLHKIHADMMHFNEFETSGGQPFMLISNDGGLSSATDYDDYFDGYTNIGLQGLNVGQFYDVRTDINGVHIYAGSQDQGFQRSYTDFDLESELPFEQLISGDYGHISFSENGDRLWTVYPGGWVTYYVNPSVDGGPATSWELISTNESVWIPPMMDNPGAEDKIYLAGGNALGGTGSFIIELEPSSGGLSATNLPYNFRIFSGGEVSAMAYSPVNHNRWYAATTNGAFFTSDDAGQNWTKSTFNVPGGHYLYGSAIHPSTVDEDVVFFGGSGYDGTPVYRSDDAGVSFVNYSSGLPPTLVFEIDGTAEDSMLFAATEAGPYACVVEDGQWYDISGITAPLQTYWSVEYIEQHGIIRYGTYGRGIWDFKVTRPDISLGLEAEIDDTPVFTVNPSLVTDHIIISFSDLLRPVSNQTLSVIDLNGRIVAEVIPSGQTTRLDVSHFAAGVYLIAYEHQVEKVVVR